jgi:hypothetical protein
MQFGDEEEAGHAEPPTVPAMDLADSFRRISVKSNTPPPIFHPLAYRGVVAEWPVEWRERWGRRANALEESGLSWRDAETQAFIEVWTQFRREQSTQPAATHVGSSDPASN